MDREISSWEVENRKSSMSLRAAIRELETQRMLRSLREINSDIRKLVKLMKSQIGVDDSLGFNGEDDRKKSIFLEDKEDKPGAFTISGGNDQRKQIVLKEEGEKVVVSESGNEEDKKYDLDLITLTGEEDQQKPIILEKEVLSKSIVESRNPNQPIIVSARCSQPYSLNNQIIALPKILSDPHAGNQTDKMLHQLSNAKNVSQVTKQVHARESIFYVLHSLIPPKPPDFTNIFFSTIPIPRGYVLPTIHYFNSNSKLLYQGCQTKNVKLGLHIDFHLIGIGLDNGLKCINCLIRLYLKYRVFEGAHKLFGESPKPDLGGGFDVLSGNVQDGSIEEAILNLTGSHLLVLGFCVGCIRVLPLFGDARFSGYDFSKETVDWFECLKTKTAENTWLELPTLTYTTINSQLHNAIMVRDYQGSICVMEPGDVGASKLYNPGLHIFFTTSIFRVHFMPWDDPCSIEGVVNRCKTVGKSVESDWREHSIGKIDFHKMQPARELTGKANVVNKELLKTVCFGNVQREWDGKLGLTPPHVDREWLPHKSQSVGYTPVDLKVVVFGWQKEPFKGCAKRIQVGLNTIQVELEEYGVDCITKLLGLRHFANWMAGVYLMFLRWFFKNKDHLQEAWVMFASRLKTTCMNCGNRVVARYDVSQGLKNLRCPLTLARRLYDISTQMWVIANITQVAEDELTKLKTQVVEDKLNEPKDEDEVFVGIFAFLFYLILEVKDHLKEGVLIRVVLFN